MALQRDPSGRLPVQHPETHDHAGTDGPQAYLFFCSTAKFFLNVGLIWLSSSTREWLRKRGLAGLGLK